MNEEQIKKKIADMGEIEAREYLRTKAWSSENITRSVFAGYSEGFKAGYAYRDSIPVKELVWVENEDGDFYADTAIGEYGVEIYPSKKIKSWMPMARNSQEFSSTDLAKAACNIHFQNIIKELLKP